MDTAALSDFVLERLSPLPVQVRAMFGGRGLYPEGKFFGIVTDGRLYLRTDDASRADLLVRGMRALQPRHRPRGPKTVDRNFEVPPDVLADADRLRAWALRAART
jgi:DNA transformation protein and related proteins